MKYPATLLVALLTTLSSQVYASPTEFVLGDAKFPYVRATREQTEKAAKVIKEIAYLDFEDHNHCDTRAYWMLWELIAQEVPGTLISVYGALVSDWSFHVVASIWPEDAAEPIVFDRSLAPDPISLSAWISKVVPGGASYDSIWGQLHQEVDETALNHYCSVIENPKDSKIPSIENSALSSHARTLFSSLNGLKKIRWSAPPNFNCQNQGLEWQ